MKPIRITDSDGDLLARDCFVLAFFCKTPATEIIEAFEGVFDLWLERTPPEAKQWAMIGENSETYKRFTKRLMTRARAEFDPKRCASRTVCGFGLGGPEETNPAYHVLFEASQEVVDDDTDTSLVEFRFPSDAVLGTGVDAIVEFAREVAARIPYDSGYGSLALNCGVESGETDFAEETRGLVFRHPGFDVPLNDSVRFDIDKQVLGAYWLTFIGPDALHELGGADTLRRALQTPIQMEEVGRGVMLRVGKHPEIGDVNRGENLPLLRSLAKVLEPVTHMGNPSLDNLFVDEEDRERWERRHLD